MNTDSGHQQFQQLRRMLVLKKYEQPPPGYFDSFHREVIARLRAGEAAQPSWLGAFSWEVSWLQRLVGLLQNRPMVAGGFGFAICGVLLAGLVFSEAGNGPIESPVMTSFVSAPPPQQDSAGEALIYRASAQQPIVQVAAPVQRPDSLFQQLKEIKTPEPLLLNSVRPLGGE